MRCNRLLGAALVEHNLIKVEHLEAANERLLELMDGDQVDKRASILGILVDEHKVLREEDVLHHLVDEAAVSLVDLRNYEVPDELRKKVDLGACWATWSVPFDIEEDFHFVATAYYLSTAARTYWEKHLKGRIIWYATSQEILGDYFDRLETERQQQNPVRATAGAA
ncbi:MAG TPA: hypothetical protein VKC60_17825 [Opitutaceae bacterium]|nr:hypothetical protein [Opitutaceae bacterium]